MTYILLEKTLADSAYFKKKDSEKGDPSKVSVVLDGVTEITLHSKKNLLITRPGMSESKPGYLVDEFQTKIRDMKKGDEEVLIRGWLTDDDEESAWNKLWKLRAMAAAGGNLTEFVLDNISFSIQFKGTVAWLADVSGTVVPNDTGSAGRVWGDSDIQGVRKKGPGDQVGRIEVSLKIILAKKR